MGSIHKWNRGGARRKRRLDFLVSSSLEEKRLGSGIRPPNDRALHRNKLKYVFLCRSRYGQCCRSTISTQRTSVFLSGVQSGGPGGPDPDTGSTGTGIPDCTLVFTQFGRTSRVLSFLMYVEPQGTVRLNDLERSREELRHQMRDDVVRSEQRETRCHQRRVCWRGRE